MASEFERLRAAWWAEVDEEAARIMVARGLGPSEAQEIAGHVVEMRHKEAIEAFRRKAAEVVG